MHMWGGGFKGLGLVGGGTSVFSLKNISSYGVTFLLHFCNKKLVRSISLKVYKGI